MTILEAVDLQHSSFPIRRSI